jgi:hypothetical protein
MAPGHEVLKPGLKSTQKSRLTLPMALSSALSVWWLDVRLAAGNISLPAYLT